ncbi:PA0069 family radical SAM protein [Sphingobacterium sp. SGG-5]|uniref:PA0069 family radical SAM protein n=1 Tax=Sphingobacterium sp. SGG-5 TaxID=2710881 RepID=UPI0013ECF423|nr:PA0069 family radical SAM protein [Sphingobacterium sp. SGG-5]NGM61807.1 PA0069 family radical SAM protein [Sphingobacterium sp. SGG-5]
MEDKKYIKGRGAQYNPHNKFKKDIYGQYHAEGIDEWEEENKKTIFIPSLAKTFVHKVDSPDVGMMYSANPYQGCEHGCIYCYARNSHEYWDMSAGLDFEQKIIVKTNAVQLFKAFISRKSWDFSPIHLSGNTDCYQPAERKFQLTRQTLETALAYQQPISIITKNSLILRDLDILSELAKKDLIKVFLSVTTLNEDTRRKLEPRTATGQQRLKVVEALSHHGIPVGINMAPIIPGLTDHEIPAVLRAAKEHGALWANYIIVRLNRQIGAVFEDWVHASYPERAQKIWHSIQNCHHGQVNNSNFGERMRGNGKIAEIIRDSFRLHCLKNQLNRVSFEYGRPDRRSIGNIQLSLF